LERLTGERLGEHLNVLVERARPSIEVDAEHGELRRDIPGRADDFDAPVAEVVEHDHVFRRLDRIAQWEHQRRDSKAGARCARRNASHEHER